MRAQWYDGNISLPGCDKNMPGVIMAMAGQPAQHHGLRRHDLPAIWATEAGRRVGLRAYGQWLAKDITEEELKEVLRNACPSGACGGMYVTPGVRHRTLV